MEGDMEIRDLRNKIFLGIFIFIIFFIPALAIFMTKFGAVDTNVISKIDKKETFVILFTKEDCEYCSDTKSILKDNKIKYEEVKTDSERYYDTIIHKLDISENDIVEPTIMYIEEGSLKTSLVNINSQDVLETYLDNNDLLK